MDLEVEDRRVRQTIRQWLPGPPAIGRMPDTDVGPDVHVFRCFVIHNYGVVLHVEQSLCTIVVRAAPRFPTCAVEVPNVLIISYASEGYVDRTERGVGPIDGHVLDEPSEPQGAGGSVVEAGRLPRTSGAVQAKNVPARRADEEARTPSAVQRRCDRLLELSGVCKIPAKA